MPDQQADVLHTVAARAADISILDAALAAQHVLRGTGVARSLLPVGPSPRRPPGRQPSRSAVTVTVRAGSRTLEVRQPQRHAVLLELRPVLRGARNPHAGAVRRTLEQAWPRIAAHAGRRASAAVARGG